MNYSTWTLDPDKSSVSFKIKQFEISTVNGSFSNFGGGGTITDDFETVKFLFTVNTGSINTLNIARDKILKSTSVFDSKNFPKISFLTTKITQIGTGGKFALVGNLTIKDVTLEHNFDVEFLGLTSTFLQNGIIDFEIFGMISRSKFGLVLYDNQSLIDTKIADEVKVYVKSRFVKLK